MSLVKVLQMIPMSRTDRLKLLAEKQGQEEQNTCADSINVQRMNARDVREGEGRAR